MVARVIHSRGTVDMAGYLSPTGSGERVMFLLMGLSSLFSFYLIWAPTWWNGATCVQGGSSPFPNIMSEYCKVSKKYWCIGLSSQSFEWSLAFIFLACWFSRCFSITRVWNFFHFPSGKFVVWTQSEGYLVVFPRIYLTAFQVEGCLWITKHDVYCCGYCLVGILASQIWLKSFSILVTSAITK